MRKTIFMITGLIIPLFLLVSCGSNEQQQAPPPEITVVEVIQKDVPIYTVP